MQTLAHPQIHCVGARTVFSSRKHLANSVAERVTKGQMRPRKERWKKEGRKEAEQRKRTGPLVKY